MVEGNKTFSVVASSYQIRTLSFGKVGHNFNFGKPLPVLLIVHSIQLIFICIIVQPSLYARCAALGNSGTCNSSMIGECPSKKHCLPPGIYASYKLNTFRNYQIEEIKVCIWSVPSWKSDHEVWYLGELITCKSCKTYICLTHTLSDPSLSF